MKLTHEKVIVHVHDAPLHRGVMAVALCGGLSGPGEAVSNHMHSVPRRPLYMMTGVYMRRYAAVETEHEDGRTRVLIPAGALRPGTGRASLRL